MKKKLILLIVAVMLCTMSNLFLSGCNNKDKTEDLPDKEVVKRYIWYELPEEEKARDAYFEEKTNYKVKHIKIPWENYDAKLLIDIAADKAPDLVYVSDEKWPMLAVKNMVREVDSLLPSNSPFWQNADAMNVYMWGGKHYGIARRIEPILLWYNKTMFNDNDVKTPREYWEEGNWNWNTFIQAAKALTGGSAGENGLLERYGFGTWRYDAMLMSNGGNFFEYTADGNINQLIDSKESMGAFQLIEDGACKDKWLNPNGMFSWINDFKEGKLAMTAEAAFITWNGVITNVDFEKDCVPFPLGPDNKEQIYPGRCDAWGICAKAKNVEGALKYIESAFEYDLNNEETSDAKKFMTPEQYAVREEMYKKPMTVSLYMGVGNIREKQFDLLNELLYNNTPVATAVAAAKPVWVNQVAICLKDNKMPEVKPFTEQPAESFDSDTVRFVSADNDGNKLGVLEASVISDGDMAIDGSSMLIKTDPDQAGAILLRSDPSKLQLPGYHSYTVSFKYKLSADMTEDSYISVTMRPVDELLTGKAMGWFDLKGKKAGEVYEFKENIMVTQEIENLTLLLLGAGLENVSIDDIQITLTKD